MSKLFRAKLDAGPLWPIHGRPQQLAVDARADEPLDRADRRRGQGR